MSIPKFSNPYSSISSTQKCTRAELFNDSIAKTTPAEGGAFKEDLEWLEKQLQSSIVYQVHEGPTGRGRGDEAGVERPRKRRRKEGSGVRSSDQLDESEFVFGGHTQ